MTKLYYLPTKVLFESGSLRMLKQEVEKLEAKKILLVTGKTAMKKLGITDRILNMLKDYRVSLFDKIEPNPSVETVEAGLRIAKARNIDLIIGLGGGSAIDAAKAIAILTKNEGQLVEYLNHKIEIKERGLPLIAIPTTAGTASEITKFSIITNTEAKTKMNLFHDYMYPKVAIVDPRLTLRLNKEITASTGLDVLSHAIESYWSVNSFEETDKHAITSIELVNQFLEKACNEPDNLEYREKMFIANLEAGKAFSQTGTTACHCVSYPLTTHNNIDHGFACALTLPSFLEFNNLVSEKDCLDKRGPEFVKTKLLNIAKALGKETVEEAAQRVKEILTNIGFPVKLKEAGVEDLDLVLIQGFNPEKLRNHPRQINREDLKKLLEKIF